MVIVFFQKTTKIMYKCVISPKWFAQHGSMRGMFMGWEGGSEVKETDYPTKKYSTWIFHGGRCQQGRREWMGSNSARPWHCFSLGMVIISPEISEEDAESLRWRKPVEVRTGVTFSDFYHPWNQQKLILRVWGSGIKWKSQEGLKNCHGHFREWETHKRSV